MLAQALEQKVTEHIQKHKHITDKNGHKKVVRNGYKPKRTIQTGAGYIELNSLVLTIREKTIRSQARSFLRT